MQVNLLPLQYRPKPSVRVWPVALTIALMLNLIIISSYWLTLQMDLAQINASLHAQEMEVANLRRQVEEAQWKEEMQSAIRVKADYIDLQTVEYKLWHPALAAIERAMVPGITLTSIRTDSSGEIVINGVPDRVETVAKFWGSLQAETCLEVVRLSTVDPGDSFSIFLREWYGREVETDDE